MSKIESVGYDQASSEMPQAVNCINHFRKMFLNSFSQDLNNKIWVAGGAVRDWLSEGHVIKDYDFFSTDRIAMAELVRALRNIHGFRHYLITKNAIKGFVMVKGIKVDVDIVKKPFANAIECVDAFDFTLCCFAVSFDRFTYNSSGIFDLIKKRLVVHSLPHPVDTLKRMIKYTKKGFAACNGTILTIAKAIAEQDPSNDSIFEFYKFD